MERRTRSNILLFRSQVRYSKNKRTSAEEERTWKDLQMFIKEDSGKFTPY